MSLDPAVVAAGPKGAPFAQITDAAGPAPRGLPEVTRVEVLPLREGDRLIVHVDGAAGMSAGGAEQIGRVVRARLGLDGLGFDVPVMVVSPGIRVEVIRPS